MFGWRGLTAMRLSSAMKAAVRLPRKLPFVQIGPTAPLGREQSVSFAARAGESGPLRFVILNREGVPLNLHFRAAHTLLSTSEVSVDRLPRLGFVFAP